MLTVFQTELKHIQEGNSTIPSFQTLLLQGHHGGVGAVHPTVHEGEEGAIGIRTLAAGTSEDGKLGEPRLAAALFASKPVLPHNLLAGLSNPDAVPFTGSKKSLPEWIKGFRHD